MPIENPKFDVAISFLSKDEPIAAAIHQRLSEGLQVFFYPRKQEELAGTDGLESMRKPFLDESRVIVVLYRQPWGKTPWTGVEEIAIKEGCLEHGGWKRLFFIVLDRAGDIPDWVPHNFIRFYADFGLDQAVGAIKARVQDNGGQYLPLTPLKRAEILKAEEQFRYDKARMDSQEGIEKILDSVSALFEEIKRQCDEVKAQGLMQIRCGIDFKERRAYQSCGITDGQVSLGVAWHQEFTNSLRHSGLVVREYEGGFMPPGGGSFVVVNPPRQLNETKYSPDLSRAREYGWKEENGAEFLSSSELAKRCVIRFMDLVDRHARGEE